jgi:hypothetical protein
MQSHNATKGGAGVIRRNKGQSILEYVIVLTAIVAAVVVGAAMFGKKDQSSGMGQLMNSAASKISTSTGMIANVSQ